MIKFKYNLKEDLLKLYERGFISYPRTNSEYLATNEKDKFKSILPTRDMHYMRHGLHHKPCLMTYGFRVK